MIVDKEEEFSDDKNFFKKSVAANIISSLSAIQERVVSNVSDDLVVLVSLFSKHLY